MTLCACQVMNRIPGYLMPSWAACWGRPNHAQWANEQSNILNRHRRNRQPARPTLRPRPPPHQARQSQVLCDICPQYRIVSTVMISAVSIGATYDTVTPEFPLRSCKTQVQSTFATLAWTLVLAKLFFTQYAVSSLLLLHLYMCDVWDSFVHRYLLVLWSV